MSIDPTNHVTDLIDPYLVGGLSVEDREAFESHTRNCADCALSLTSAHAFDASLFALLIDARPDTGLEDRLLEAFRKSAPPPRLHPNVRRAAIGIAATILLGGFGYVASTAMEEGRLPLNGSHDGYASVEQLAQTIAKGGVDYFEKRSGAADRERSSSNFRQIGLAMRMYGEGIRSPQDMAEQLGRGTAASSAASPQQNSFNTEVDRLTLSSPAEMAKEAQGKLGIETSGRVDLNGVKGPTYRDSIFSTGPRREPSAGSEPGIVSNSGLATKTNKATDTLPHDQYDQVLQPIDYDGTPSVTYFKPAAHASPDINQTSQFTQLPTTGVPGSIGNLPELGTAAGKEVTKKLEKLADAPAKDSEIKAEIGNQKAPHQTEQLGESKGEGLGDGQSPPKPLVAGSTTGRKVIRSGDMTFEVDSFDSTVTTLTKIVDEEGGYVSTTDSDKLANGKVKGTIVLRVPPDRLDTLVLKLRGIGDLKSQKVNAQDITKQYTDLQSELRAARAMEDRLLEIIKTGKGEVKDLLEAEKQLGVWREKIEQVEGEIRYDDNLVSLSTLSVTLIEKDIKAAAYSSETEQVTMALETANVESAYDKAKEAIAEAKGRIVQSDLQQHDAGQFSGTITAALPPDSADTVIARLRQLDGRVANFQRQRAQKNQGGTTAPLDAVKLHREDVTLSLTMYNLANVEPRRTVTLLLAAPVVDESYRKVLDAIASAGGRVVTASVNRGKPEQSTAAMKFDIAAEKADVLLAAVRAAGEVVHSETTDNPDTQNVTEAKRGFVLTIESLAAAAARETQQLKVAAGSVPDGFNDLLNAVLSKSGRIVSSQLNQQDRENVTGVLEFEVSRDAAAAIDAAVNKAGDVIARNISRSQDTENTVDSKVRFHFDLIDALSLAPRQKTTLAIEVSDVNQATRDLMTAAIGAGGRSAGSTESSLDRNGNLLTRVVVEVPLAKAASIVDQVTGMGTVRVNETSTDEHASEGRLARARVEVTFGNSAAAVGGQENAFDAVRHGLAVSGEGLRWSLTMIIIGFCFVAPWALIVWILWRILRKRSKVSSAPIQAPA